MSSWAGFSEEELQRLQQKESAMVRGRKPAQAGRNRQQLQRERALQLSAQKNFVAPGLPPEQQLAKPPQKVACQPAAAPAAPAVAEVDKPKIGKENWSEGLQPAAEGRASSEVKELEKQEVELREKTRLEHLQQEQKIIEERNRQKKALLTKTIAEKSKQTQAEAVKLKRIQKELQALDDMVSNDIGILRGRIEEASWDFTAARKRYQRAEAEYVTAKLDLHKKTEVKEQLAEHLCAIIQQNELRKAHKLEELMKQLQLEASEEELERLRIQEEEEKRRIQEEGDKKLQQEEGDKKLQQQQQEQEEEEKRRKQQQHGENLQEEEKVCEREEKSGEKGLKHQNGVQDSVTTGEVKVTEASERSDEGEEITRMVENGHQSEGGSSS